PFGHASGLRNLSIQACKKKNRPTSVDQKKSGKRGKSPNSGALERLVVVIQGTNMVHFIRPFGQDD
ncbi:TPA: hypothetical protein ACU910_007071, partial [Burkholderia contaminans]